MMIAEATTNLYAIGDRVPQTGWYLCVPCGYMQQFQAGEQFSTCEVCFAGTESGPMDYQEEEQEFWEFIS